MKSSLLVAMAVLLAAEVVSGQYPQGCRGYWSAPSPTLSDACHHSTGPAFATCDCPRAYTSPHVVGYGGMDCCVGYQPPSCLTCLTCGHGLRYWAPAYANGSAGLPSQLVEYERHGAGDLGYQDYIEGHAAGFAEWEPLGQIPSDMAIAGGLGGGRATATGGAAPRPGVTPALPGMNL